MNNLANFSTDFFLLYFLFSAVDSIVISSLITNTLMSYGRIKLLPPFVTLYKANLPYKSLPSLFSLFVTTAVDSIVRYFYVTIDQIFRYVLEAVNVALFISSCYSP